MTLPHPLIDLVSGCHLVVEMLGLDLEVNGGDDQRMTETARSSTLSPSYFAPNMHALLCHCLY